MGPLFPRSDGESPNCAQNHLIHSVKVSLRATADSELNSDRKNACLASAAIDFKFIPQPCIIPLPPLRSHPLPVLSPRPFAPSPALSFPLARSLPPILPVPLRPPSLL